MKLYVASSLDNIPQVQRFMRAALAAGHTLTYDWTVHGPVFNPLSTRAENEEALTATAEAELNGVVEADAVVVLLPGGRGTHVELGGALVAAAYVLDAFTRTYLALEADPLGNTQADEPCVGQTAKVPCFYYHPRVVRVAEADEGRRFARLLQALAQQASQVGHEAA